MSSAPPIGRAEAPTIEDVGARMRALMEQLWSHPRSLTGDGVRATLADIGRRVPVDVHEIPSGERLYDWTVPDEWTLRRAWITDPAGDVVADTDDNPLHVLGYSDPIRRTMPLAELREHLFTLPEQPERIPYRTSYWSRGWGFCLSQRTADALPDGEYSVVIDAALAPGHLTYGECVLPGEEAGEVLLSTPVCHPGLANDNLSGVVLLAVLAELLQDRVERRHTYRFLWSPGTLGPLAWLSRNEDHLDRLVAGLAPMCVGDAGPLTYKASRRGDALVDRAARIALRDSGDDHVLRDFVPWGGDERQYCSPGFDLPVGVLTRTPPGEYPENHTSADDLDFVDDRAMGEACLAHLATIDILEGDRTYLATNPKGEPQLGRRGLTTRLGGQKGGDGEMAMFWTLNLADGEHSLLDVAEKSGLAFSLVREAADDLLDAELLRPFEESALK